MEISVKFIFPLFVLHLVRGLPNVYQYEVEKAKELAHFFEAGYKDFQLEEQRLVKLYGFSWKDCSTSPPIVNIKSLSVSPDPLAFPGTLTIQTDFALKKNIVAPLKAELKIEKKVAGIYIEVPCIDSFGSCTYEDICQYLAVIKDQCPDPVKKAGIDCSCPIKQGSYSLPKTDFDLTASIIPSGDYHVIANLTESGAEAGCLDLYISVA